jgi:DNA-binding transcriptional regulator YhcF (GntR family)
VRIVAPGNSKTVWDTLASGIEYDTAIDPDSGEYHTTWEVLQQCANGDQPDTAKYPKAWARFMRRGEKADDGWPIEEWGVVTRSYAESLKLLSIPTVEALAALSDANAATIMGGRKYRDLAKAAVDERARNRIVASEQAKASRAEEKVNLQDEKIKQLEATIANMQTQFAQGMRAQAPVIQQQGAPPPAPALKTASVKTSKRTREIVDAGEHSENA